MTAVERDCVIAGGGPAGMVLGHLLARRGLAVTVLEKHADFLRDFRGDTIHPSTITLLGELGLRERFLALPVHRIDALDAVIDGRRLRAVDFSTLPGPDDFMVFAPQWDFLDFLAAESGALPGYELRMSTTATEVLRDGDRVAGLRAQGPDGELEIHARLTVAADGRHSAIRGSAGLPSPVEVGVPIDVLWLALPKPEGAPPPTLAYVAATDFVLTLDRGDHYQAGMVIPKRGFDDLRAAGIEPFRRRIAATAPVLETVVGTIADWDQVKLLTVQIDDLPQWHLDGFVAIGDAAHAMSPVGGVGVNYAIQDAVALANAVAAFLAAGPLPRATLAAVQARRQPPARRMQRIQRFVHARVSRPATGRGRAIPRPVVGLLRLLQPLLQRVTARVVGLGFLPEHVAPGP